MLVARVNRGPWVDDGWIMDHHSGIMDESWMNYGELWVNHGEFWVNHGIIHGFLTMNSWSRMVDNVFQNA